MSRLNALENRQDKLEKDLAKSKQTSFRFPRKVTRLLKREKKKPEYIVIQYLTLKYQIRFLLARVVGGDIIVVNNKVHKINPKAIYRYGKKMWYIIREIDRLPVSNIDYNKVKKRGDDTESDVPLIKAVLGAIKKPNPLQSKNLWIIIAIAVIGFIVFFTFFGK
jgi:hypothetical protein